MKDKEMLKTIAMVGEPKCTRCGRVIAQRHVYCEEEMAKREPKGTEMSGKEWKALSAEEQGVLTVARGRIVSHYCPTHDWVKPRIVFLDMQRVIGDWQKVGSVVCSYCKSVSVRGKKVQMRPGLRPVYIPHVQ